MERSDRIRTNSPPSPITPDPAFLRTAWLLGNEGLERLRNATVAVFGIGGVGSYVCESLARAGIGRFRLIDSDTVCVTNINRQLIATHRTVGRRKTAVMAERIFEINPSAAVEEYPIFYEGGRPDLLSECDYVVDAIDTVSAKIALATECRDRNIPLISCMGTGNKLDPSALEIADLYETSVCPLCRIMRHELRKRGIDSLRVVYSKEPPHPSTGEELSCRECGRCPGKDDGGSKRRNTPGSTSFVPPSAGLLIASYVVRELIKG